MKHCYFIIVLLIASQVSTAQHAMSDVAWDLSYESILELNGVKWDHSQGTLYTWLIDRDQEHQDLVNFIENELQNQPLAAFLIDHPTFPSGGRTTILGVKRQSGCFFFWRSTDENMKDFKRSPLSKELFDQVFKRLHALKQRGYENMGGPEKAYAGFLSTFTSGQNRQLLLHINDFMEFDVENQEILRVGRIFEIENSLQVNNN